jgi:hypothetical protein
MAQKIGGPAGPPPLSDAREHELRQKFYAFDRDKDGSALTLQKRHTVQGTREDQQGGPAPQPMAHPSVSQNLCAAL